MALVGEDIDVSLGLRKTQTETRSKIIDLDAVMVDSEHEAEHGSASNVPRSR